MYYLKGTVSKARQVAATGRPLVISLKLYKLVCNSRYVVAFKLSVTVADYTTAPRAVGRETPERHHVEINIFTFRG